MPREWLRSAARLTSVRGRIFIVLSLVALLVGVARLSGGGSQAQAQAARAGIARASSSASTEKEPISQASKRGPAVAAASRSAIGAID